jgi:transcriptional regulator with XRE-family HTH domain
MSLGAMIRFLRKQKGWTQDQLAARAGIGRSYISMLENDERPNVSARIVDRLAGALGVTSDYLLRRADNPSSPKNGRDLLLEEIIARWDHLPEWKKRDLTRQAAMIYEEEHKDKLHRKGILHEDEKERSTQAGPGQQN